MPPFDPNTAPVVKMTDQERAAVNREMNDVILKLREAGVTIHGNFKWRMVGEPYWNPSGFDFYCEDWKRLHDLASKSSQLGFDPADMPGSDPWAQAKVKSVGFTQKGKPPLVHIDFAIDRPGLCRMYILKHGPERRIDNLKRAKKVTARDSDVFKTIYKRMLAVGLDLDFHIGRHLEAKRSTLDGIDFAAVDHKALIQALTDLEYGRGQKVFAPGSKNARGHGPLNASYMATEGIGFRQIWYAPVSNRPMAEKDPRKDPAMDANFSAHFGDSRNLPDLTSLHCAVSENGCNIHIDEMGFVTVDANGNVILDPDFLRHLLVELVWKTNLQGKLPFWALDRVNFDIPSSMNNYARAGVGVDVFQTKRFKGTLRGTCATHGGMECSGTFTIGVNF